MIDDMHDINVIMTNTKREGHLENISSIISYLFIVVIIHISFESQYHLSNGKIGDADFTFTR